MPSRPPLAPLHHNTSHHHHAATFVSYNKSPVNSHNKTKLEAPHGGDENFHPQQQHVASDGHDQCFTKKKPNAHSTSDLEPMDISRSQEDPSRAPESHLSSPNVESLYIERNPHHATRYVKDFSRDVCEMYFQKERNHRCNVNYMEKQPLTESMRSTLIDWLIDVHHKFRLSPETLYLSVNLLDRFCAKEIIHKNRYQLLGTACLWVATKYEELFPPPMERFVRVAAGAFLREDLLAMEQILLCTLQYNLTVVTPFQFLKRFLLCSCADENVQLLALHFSEICLVHYEMVKYLASDVAAACVHMAQLFAGASPDTAWSEQVVYYSRREAQAFRPVTEDLFYLLRLQIHAKYDASKRKYRRESRNSVADLIPLHLRRVGESLSLL